METDTFSTEEKGFRPWSPEISQSTIIALVPSGKNRACRGKTGGLGLSRSKLRRASAGSRHERRLRQVRQGESPEDGKWTIYDKRYWPGDTFGDHLGFALRHENLDLLALKRIFEAVPQDTVATFVRTAPTGASNRRVWFFYEFMTGRMLDIEDAPGVRGRRVPARTAAFAGVLFAGRGFFQIGLQVNIPVASSLHVLRDVFL